jgi:hypothetical protein
MGLEINRNESSIEVTLQRITLPPRRDLQFTKKEDRSTKGVSIVKKVGEGEDAQRARNQLGKRRHQGELSMLNTLMRIDSEITKMAGNLRDHA